MERLAIIGSGVAGLACAHFLHSRYDLTLFEGNDYPGGHSNTLSVGEGDQTVHMDTGFMVYNEVTYPNLTRFFRELGVEVKPTSMSFSVQHLPSDLEYCGSSINQLFAQRRNLFNPRYIRMLLQVDRFNREAVQALEDPRYQGYTLAQYMEERLYGEDFLKLYLAPMACAVWSEPPELILEFPAMTLLRFFHNHGFLGLHTQHPWWTVSGGSRNYVEKAVAPFRDRIRLGRGAARVERTGGKVRITATDGTAAIFDKAVLACHADEALGLLADPTPQEARLLAEFKYQKNRVTVHSDGSVMPKSKLAWSSWNYRIEPGAGDALKYSTHYWMNSLQGVSEKENYFVSLNEPGIVSPSRILRTLTYDHPVYTLGAVRAQKELPSLNALGPVYFCGSYFRYGFHEDAFVSGLDAARAVTGSPIWN